MSALIRPRGPLPSRVYWFRRALLVCVLLAVVLTAVQLLGRGGEEPEGTGATGTAATVAAARQQAGEQRSASPPASPSADPSAQTEPAEPSPTAAPPAKPSPTKRPLPQPDGPCEEADVLITPDVPDTRPDGSVDITLALTTVESAACTFEVNPESVFVTISGEDRTVWASQHCSAVVPTEEVVPRRTKAATVVLRWDGRESAVGCPESEWVESGDYTVAALARGSVNIRKSTFTLETSD